MGRALVVVVLLAGVARAGERIPVIVTLADQVDLTSLRASVCGGSKAERRARVVAALQSRTMPPALDALLRDDGVREVRRLWLVNGVAANVTPEAARRLATLPGVARVALDATVQLLAAAHTAPLRVSPLRSPTRPARAPIATSPSMSIRSRGACATRRSRRLEEDRR